MESLFSAVGGEITVLTDEDIRTRLFAFLEAMGPRDDVLVLPPDYTRFHSQAGKITRFVSEYYNVVDPSSSVPPSKKQKLEPPPEFKIMPALGTHAPMTDEQIRSMFGKQLAELQPTPFLAHDWRNDVETIGHVPPEMVSKATNGMVNEPWPAQLNKFVWKKRHQTGQHKTLVLSIGQVVPHEVMGMANFNKNLFVGVGGVEAINLSHFIGAVHGMENMMGRASNPLRSILNYASEEFLHDKLDLWYILTVMGSDSNTGDLVMRGLYIGNDIECYNQACALSLKVNFTMLDKSPKKFVVHLDKDEFHSTWLGNKAIYRTRMAIADGGELIILAPGVRRFGEDDCVDKLIQKYGYVGTPVIMGQMKENEELKENLSAVAHLIHGSTEGRFRVTYCPGHLTREEVESVGFAYGDLETLSKRYDTGALQEGWNTEETADGGTAEFYYISNPALGLWAVKKRFKDDDSAIIDNLQPNESNKVSSTEMKHGAGSDSSFLSASALSAKFPSLAKPLSSASPILALLFAAAWCDDCQGVTPFVKHVYETQAEPKLFEVIYVSSDSSESEMKGNIDPTWNAVAFARVEERSSLKRHFGACAKKETEGLGMTTEERKFGIPTIILLERVTGRILSTDGVSHIMGPKREDVAKLWKSLLE